MSPVYVVLNAWDGNDVGHETRETGKFIVAFTTEEEAKANLVATCTVVCETTMDHATEKAKALGFAGVLLRGGDAEGTESQ